MANYTKLTDLFTGIANAIRSKTGSTNEIIADNFPSEINNIVTVQEGTADATANASNIDSGKTAYVNGAKVTGTSTKVDTSDATAAAGDIASGKTAYVNGEKITGTLDSNEIVTGYVASIRTYTQDIVFEKAKGKKNIIIYPSIYGGGGTGRIFPGVFTVTVLNNIVEKALLMESYVVDALQVSDVSSTVSWNPSEGKIKLSTRYFAYNIDFNFVAW